MKTYRIILYIIAFISMLYMAFPVSADVIDTSFKRAGVKSLVNTTNLKCNRTRGRNQRGSAAQRISFRNNQPKCTTTIKVGKYKQPKVGGLRIDACVLGAGWKKSDPERCDTSRLEIIANNFCRSKGYKKSILISKTSHKGRHAVLNFRRHNPKSSYWKRHQGNMVIKKVYCQ